MFAAIDDTPIPPNPSKSRPSKNCRPKEFDPATHRAILESWSIEESHYCRRRAKAIDICIEHLMHKMEDPDLPIEHICKIGDTLAKLKREDNAADRTAAAIRVAETRASKAKRRQGSGYESEAPWGRHDDGTPCTQEEFNDHLRRAMKDIYGINMTDAHFQPYPIRGGVMDLTKPRGGQTSSAVSDVELTP